MTNVKSAIRLSMKFVPYSKITWKISLISPYEKHSTIICAYCMPSNVLKQLTDLLFSLHVFFSAVFLRHLQIRTQFLFFSHCDTPRPNSSLDIGSTRINSLGSCLFLSLYSHKSSTISYIRRYTYVCVHCFCFFFFGFLLIESSITMQLCGCLPVGNGTRDEARSTAANQTAKKYSVKRGKCQRRGVSLRCDN